MDTTNMALDDQLRVFSMNLVSRFVGFCMRSLVIFFGMASISVGFVVGSLASLIFILLPAISIFLIFNSIFVK